MKQLPYLALLLCGALLMGCSAKKPLTTAVKKEKLSIKQSDGTNGAAVVYEKSNKYYYTVFAGNAKYPLETFDINGKPLQQTTAGIDVRGLWYNKKTKRLEGNGAGETGYFAINLNKYGYPVGEPVVLRKGEFQPDFNSVGVWDSNNDKILFYADGQVHVYSKQGKFESSFALSLPTIIGNINSTTLIYTGYKDKELGVLDYAGGKVYLFDYGGNLSATVQLPSTVQPHDRFRFSFANDRVWLFDVDNREWTAYQIFK